MKNIFKFTSLLFAAGYSLFAALPVYAALVPDCRGASCTPCNFLQLISNLVVFMVRDVTAPLAGLLFLIGGIMMVSAGGDEMRYKKGKDIFKNTAIGVLIVLASWIIVNTLITAFGSSVAGFVPGNWWSVNCR